MLARMDRAGAGLHTFPRWALCQAPLILVLAAAGFTDAGGAAYPPLAYLGTAAALCLFSMALAVAKSFLVMWAGGIRLSLTEATRRLLPLHCGLVLLEAGLTLWLLVWFRALGGERSIAYTAVEQICLFGQELLFACGAGAVLYFREGVSKTRSVLVMMGCFLLSSAWLLLSVFFG